MPPERLSMAGSDPGLYELLSVLLTAGTEVRIEVTGKSMLPTLKSGDTVLVRKVAENDLRRGDIILFRGESGSLLLHRLIALERNSGGSILLAKGDALRSFDARVTFANVLGKVCAVEKNVLKKRPERIDLESKPQRFFSYMRALSASIVSSLRSVLSRIKSFLISRST